MNGERRGPRKGKVIRKTLAAVLFLTIFFPQVVFAAPSPSASAEAELSASSLLSDGSDVIHLEETSVDGTPDRLLVRGMTYRTLDPKDDPVSHLGQVAFLGECEYRIEDFTAPVIIGQESASRAGGTYISKPFTGDAKDHLPEATREFDGVQMELVSSKLIDTITEERTEDQTVQYEYEGLEADAAVPSTQEIEFTDEDTGHTFSVRLPLISSETTDRYWASSFSFPIHIENYDADVYELGDIEIPKEDRLIDHAGDFLRMLSLDPAYYEILTIDWTGEPYEDADGVLCREARASGRKRLRDVSAVYGGPVTYPGVPAKAWECEYREVVPAGQSILYTMSTDVTFCRASLTAVSGDDGTDGKPSGLKGLISAIYEAVRKAVGKVVELVREHPAESVLCLVVSAAFIVFVLLTGTKRECIYQKNIRCPHRRRIAKTCETCVYKYQTPDPPKGLFKAKKN